MEFGQIRRVGVGSQSKRLEVDGQRRKTRNRVQRAAMFAQKLADGVEGRKRGMFGQRIAIVRVRVLARAKKEVLRRARRFLLRFGLSHV